MSVSHEAWRKTSPLNPFGADEIPRMVAETPRGASVKFTYDLDLEAFTVMRALVLGITYPFVLGLYSGNDRRGRGSLDALGVHHSAALSRRHPALPTTWRC